MGIRTENDNFDFELLALIFIFMSVHFGIHLFLTFVKNTFLIQYIKLLKYVEIFNNKKYRYYNPDITLNDIMDPFDFELLVGEDFINDIIIEKKAQDNNIDDNINNYESEGSDIGYSSHDFHRKDKLKNNMNKKQIITNILKKKWKSIKLKQYQYSTMTTVENNGISFDGDTANNAIKIVFGSNMHQRFNDMPAVRALTSYNPHIVMFLGNNIYVDEAPRKCGLLKTIIDDDTTFGHSMNAMFNFWKLDDIKLDPSTEYQRLLKHKDFILCNPDDSLPIVLGTWSKHDYGGQNKNAEYENKYHSKSAFLSFLDRIDLKHELTNYIDTMKASTYRGIYYHYDYHYVFEHDDDIIDEQDKHIFIRFVMLDLKFHRKEEDMFGVDQWIWINKLLQNTKERKDKPDWHIFAFGTPCFVEKFNLNENMQSAATYVAGDGCKQFKLPNILSPIPMSDYNEWDILSKRKLLMLINEIGIANRTIFVSGNMNYSQVLQENEYKIYEFVSSSLTHSIPSCIPNDYYIKNKYEFNTAQTDVCNVNGYGYLEIDKNGWKFCINDAKGNVHIPLSKRF